MLTVLFILLLRVIILLPVYESWLKRIHNYYREFRQQRHALDIETRMTQRHGINYLIPKFLKEYLEERPDAVFLLPSQKYLKQYYPNSLWAEPKAFYYFAGKIRTVEYDDADVRTATHSLIVDEDRRPRLIFFQNDEERERIIALLE